MLDASRLHVLTARSNPLGWAAPQRNWLRFAHHMHQSGVNLTVVECAYGDEPFRCDGDGAHHIGVRAKTRGWNKENLLNLGVQRTPEAQYITWIDADVIFHLRTLTLVGAADASMPSGTTPAYRAEVKRWEARALRHINTNIGFVSGTIEHLFHGRKGDRGYLSRWDMFVQHAFDPHEDLQRNSHGVLEFATNKPELRHAFDLYLHSRNEDVNTVA